MIIESHNSSNKMINEAFFDKNSFLGKLISFIPGFSESKKSEKELSAYEKNQQDWFNKWQDERKKNLKRDAEHKIELKVTNYSIEQQRKFNKHKAEQKVKEFKQKQELAARNAILARLEKEQKAIDNWNANSISTPEFMNTVIRKTEKIYDEATPAETKLKDNVMGVIASTYYDEQGNFISDPKERAKRMDELYGNGEPSSGLQNELFQDPAIKAAYEAYEKAQPKNEQEFIAAANKISNDPDIRSNKEIDDDIKEIEAYKNEVSETSKKINDKVAKRDKTKKLNDKVDANRKKKGEELEQQKAAMDGWPEKREDITPEIARESLAAQLKKQYDDAVEPEEGKTDTEHLFIIVDEDGRKSKKVNPNFKGLKEYQRLGIKQEDLANCTSAESITELVNSDKVSDDALNNYVQGVYDKRKKLQQEYDDLDKAYKENEQVIKDLEDGKDGEKGINQLEEDLDKIKTDYPGIDEKIRKVAGKDNDGTPIKSDDIEQAIAGLQQEKENATKTAEQIKHYREKAMKDLQSNKVETGYQKAYDALSDEQKQELDSLSPKGQDIIKTETVNGKTREYIEVDGSNGEKVNLYKPTEDDPNYEEHLAQWDAAVTARHATMKIGPKPQPKDPNNVTLDELKAMKQWEADKKAKEAAVQKFIEDKSEKKSKIAGKTPEDALDYLADQEWMTDPENKDATEEIDAENDNESDIEDTEADKKENDKKIEIENQQKELDKLKDELNGLTDEDKKKKEDEIKKAQEKLENLQKELENLGTERENSNKKNPAKIWKRRKNENTGKTTKRYYYSGSNAKRKGESISQKEYQAKIKAFKAAKAAKTDNNSFINKHPVIFEKRQWTMTPLFGKK